MHDERAHERIDDLNGMFKRHLEEHSNFEHKLDTAIANTKQVADNTNELVEIFRGAKGIRKLMSFSWPFFIVIAALLLSAIAWLKGIK
jgi:hypothetical protein